MCSFEQLREAVSQEHLSSVLSFHSAHLFGTPVQIISAAQLQIENKVFNFFNSNTKDRHALESEAFLHLLQTSWLVEPLIWHAHLSAFIHRFHTWFYSTFHSFALRSSFALMFTPAVRFFKCLDVLSLFLLLQIIMRENIPYFCCCFCFKITEPCLCCSMLKTRDCFCF